MSEWYFVDASLMASAVNACGEECFDNFKCGFGANEACGKDEYVCVVMLPGECGEFCVPADCGPYFLMFVECHGDSVAGSAESNGGVDVALFHGFCAGVREVGIVAAFFGMSAEVDCLISVLFEKLFDFKFQEEACMVGAESYFF